METVDAARSGELCSHLLRQRAFREDVDREQQIIETPPPEVAAPEVVKIVPTKAPRGWPDGETGYGLVDLRDGVLSVKKHFPQGTPIIGGSAQSETQTCASLSHLKNGP